MAVDDELPNAGLDTYSPYPAATDEEVVPESIYNPVRDVIVPAPAVICG